MEHDINLINFVKRPLTDNFVNAHRLSPFYFILKHNTCSGKLNQNKQINFNPHIFLATRFSRNMLCITPFSFLKKHVM